MIISLPGLALSSPPISAEVAARCDHDHCSDNPHDKHTGGVCTVKRMSACTSSFVPSPPYCLSHVPRYNCFITHFCADDEMKRVWSKKLKTEIGMLDQSGSGSASGSKSLASALPLPQLAVNVAASQTIHLP